MNSVVLIGRLTKEPELRNTSESQTAVCSFTLAIDREFSKEKKADFPRCIAFGKTAELVERYLGKGRLVAIQGRVQTGSYVDKDGKTVYTTDIVADRVQFLDKADKNAEGVPDGFQVVEDDTDDIPF